MLQIERRSVHEVEQWTRDAQLRNYIYERPSKATVRRDFSAPLRGQLCVLVNCKYLSSERGWRF